MAPIKKGLPMAYGVTIPKGAPHPALAEAFVRFLLGPNQGMAIMEKNGQPSLVPTKTATHHLLPKSLKKYAQAQ